MNKIANEKHMCRIFNVLAVLMFAALFYFCLKLSGTNISLKDEHIIFSEHNILMQVLKLALAFAALFIAGKASDFLYAKINRNAFLALCCTISAIISVYWVLNSATGPQGDQRSVAKYAVAFNNGDFSSLQTGEYVSVYQQQLGLITLMRPFFAVFGDKNYLAYQLLVALSVPLILFIGTMVIRHISGNDMKAEFYYLLFALTCFPMYAYTPFVYGDLISVPFALMAIWMLLSCIDRFSIKKLVILALSTALAIMLRHNVIIIAVAMLIVAFIKLLKAPRKQNAVIAFAIIVGLIAPQLFTKALYADKTAPGDTGMPAFCHIAMGLNDGNPYPGWYSAENMSIFENSGYDPDEASRVALGKIKGYVKNHISDPGKAVTFFSYKMNAQWNVPMYQCLVMNNRINGEQSKIVANIYNGGILSTFVQQYAKIFQLVLYGAILALLIAKRKSWNNIENYTLLIAVFGGFLFSLIWEAKARYVFPYLLLMLPYIGLGINSIMQGLSKIISK